MARISVKKGLAGSKINIAQKRKIGGKAGLVSEEGWPNCPRMLDDECIADCGSICDPDIPNKVAKGELVSNPVSKLRINVRKRVIR